MTIDNCSTGRRPRLLAGAKATPHSDAESIMKKRAYKATPVKSLHPLEFAAGVQGKKVIVKEFIDVVMLVSSILAGEGNAEGDINGDGATNILDMWDLFVNEITGSTILFIFLAIVAIAWIAMKTGMKGSVAIMMIAVFLLFITPQIGIFGALIVFIILVFVAWQLSRVTYVLTKKK